MRPHGAASPQTLLTLHRLPRSRRSHSCRTMCTRARSLWRTAWQRPRRRASGCMRRRCVAAGLLARARSALVQATNRRQAAAARTLQQCTHMSQDSHTLRSSRAERLTLSCHAGCKTIAPCKRAQYMPRDCVVLTCTTQTHVRARRRCMASFSGKACTR